MTQVREELHLQTAAGVRQALQAHVAGRSDCVRGGRRLHPGDCGGARLDRLPRRRVPRALPPLPSCPTHSATSHPFWMVEQAAPRGRGGCRTHTCRSAKSFSVSVSACIHPAAPASPGDQGDTHATRTSEGLCRRPRRLRRCRRSRSSTPAAVCWWIWTATATRSTASARYIPPQPQRVSLPFQV